MSDLQARAQVVQRDYQLLQAEQAQAVEDRQKLGAQLAENESVAKEFANLSPSNTVYKLVGGVLLKQEQAEAKSNVEKRLEYIRKEVERVEGKLTEVASKMQAKQQEVVQIQTEANGGTDALQAQQLQTA